MKILITGANGYLGQGIVKYLLDSKNEVIATDYNTNNIDIRAKIIEGDLFRVSNPYEFFDSPDVVLHLAWRDGFVHYSDAHFNDFALHYKFLKAFTNTPIKTIACMGTMHEIGFFEGCIDENTPCRPVNYYGIAKNALREALSYMCKQHDKNFLWLRGFYIVGNSEFGNSIFSKITKAEKMGQSTFPFTMGLNQYDFLDYKDFVEQVSLSVTQNEINGIVNICSGRPEKLADRVSRFIKDNGYKITLKYGAYPDRPYDSKAVWGDDRKIRLILKKRDK